MKKTAYTLTLSATVTAAVFLSACGSSSSSGEADANYAAGGCMNKVAMKLADGASCVVAYGGNSHKLTCDASFPIVVRETTVIATGVASANGSTPTWSYVRDAAHGDGNTLVSCI